MHDHILPIILPGLYSEYSGRNIKNAFSDSSSDRYLPLPSRHRERRSGEDDDERLSINGIAQPFCKSDNAGLTNCHSNDLVFVNE